MTDADTGAEGVDEAAAADTADTADAAEATPDAAERVLEFVAKALVDDVDAVEIERSRHRGQTVLELRVGQGETGKVIGRRGRTAQALRTVVRAASARDGSDVTVDIVD